MSALPKQTTIEHTNYSPELRLIIDEPEINYTALDSPDGHETLPEFFDQELIDNIPAILIKIFGRRLPLVFYLAKAKELAFLFGAINDFYDPRIFITQEDLSNITIEEPPLRDFSSIEELRAQLLQADWEHVGITDVLYRLSQLDPRQAIGVAFCFGLLPNIKGLRQFYEAIGVSRQILDTFAVDGYRALGPVVAQPSELGIFKTIIHVRKFLKEIQQYDSSPLVRFIDGQMIGYESVTYQLAQHVIDGTSVEVELLSKHQRKIYKMFKRYYKEYGMFPRYEDLAEATGLSEVTIYKHIQRILEIIENAPTVEYYQTKNGKLMEMDDSSVLARVFEAYSANPALAEHENLSELQKQCLRELFTLSEELNVAYPGIGIVAKRLKLDRRRVVELFATALESIKKPAVYYEKTNEQLSERDIRVQIIAKGGLEYINALSIRPINKHMVALLLELIPNTHTFKYSVAEVTVLIGAKTNNPIGGIYNVIRSILAGENDANIAFADELGIALTRNHLRIAELLSQYDLQILIQSQPEYEDLIRLLAFTNEQGRYLSYDNIAAKLGMQTSRISELVKRFVRILESIES